MFGLKSNKSEFGWELSCQKENCTKSFAFGGRSHCRCCIKAFCIDHIHTNNNVDKQSKLYKLCDDCNINNSNNNNAVTNNLNNLCVQNDNLVWVKGKQIFDDM